MNDISIGKPLPLGSSITLEGVNFSLIATNAEYVEILLFEEENSINPKKIFRLDLCHNTGPYWHAEINNLSEGSIYAFRVKQKSNGVNNNYSKKFYLILVQEALLDGINIKEKIHLKILRILILV